MAARKPDTCGSCRFARPIEGNELAISCQRHPPKVTAVVGTQITSHWPLLAKGNWCGEYATRAKG